MMIEMMMSSAAHSPNTRRDGAGVSEDDGDDVHETAPFAAANDRLRPEFSRRER